MEQSQKQLDRKKHKAHQRKKRDVRKVRHSARGGASGHGQVAAPGKAATTTSSQLGALNEPSNRSDEKKKTDVSEVVRYLEDEWDRHYLLDKLRVSGCAACGLSGHAAHACPAPACHICLQSTHPWYDCSVRHCQACGSLFHWAASKKQCPVRTLGMKTVVRAQHVQRCVKQCTGSGPDGAVALSAAESLLEAERVALICAVEQAGGACGPLHALVKEKEGEDEDEDEYDTAALRARVVHGSKALDEMAEQGLDQAMSGAEFHVFPAAVTGFLDDGSAESESEPVRGGGPAPHGAVGSADWSSGSGSDADPTVEALTALLLGSGQADLSVRQPAETLGPVLAPGGHAGKPEPPLTQGTPPAPLPTMALGCRGAEGALSSAAAAGRDQPGSTSNGALDAIDPPAGIRSAPGSPGTTVHSSQGPASTTPTPATGNESLEELEDWLTDVI